MGKALAIDATAAAFSDTRRQSVDVCRPLEIEDYGLQAAVFASPPKWHLAHTTWFFETFILKPFVSGYAPVEPIYEVLFNSYYNGIGEQHPRHQRGLLSRPTLDEVLAYREHVDAAMAGCLELAGRADPQAIRQRTVLGIEHERQHQELFFTDLKYSLSVNPLYPAYLAAELPVQSGTPVRWLGCEGGLVEIGHDGSGFCFDNELPRHRCFVEPFEIASRLVTNEEYQAFVDDDGYGRPELWLADGWTTLQSEGWKAPLHWLERDGQALEFTLHGLQPRRGSRPVCHVSGYEADAFARWANARLPTEQEWETVAAGHPAGAAGMDDGVYHPQAAPADEGPTQLYGACWQWTRSAYGPYPGYSASPGAIGEYNGKFMSNQWVLRGGSCVTKSSQARPTYRNFFYPQDRWQFSGIRLARSVEGERRL
jgi:ergothioneine biosynthesis protein EgtB